MFYIVPSNRQEYLLKVLIALLDSDYKDQRLGIFESSSIMVESLGMKHYVHMGIASESKVAMNLDFPLVSRGIYNLCRAILGEARVPKESLYKREILVWRIEQILRSEDFQQNDDAEQANMYWQSALDQEKARFLLAQNTADVFEQYMQFRPDWFAKWELNESVLQTPNATLEPWQRAIWQRLVSKSDSYPAKIIQQAIDEFRPGNPALPKVLYIFVVNALTPEQLTFLTTISQQVDIYFFHLNPCVEYWGDLISDRALMHERLRKGMNHLLDEASPNSLLANLGKQGRVLFNQLQQIDYPDFTDRQLFKSSEHETSIQKVTLLQAIQQDLLSAQTGLAGPMLADNTVSIHSCHNHIREIQVLHDYLLHIIEDQVQQAQNNQAELVDKIQPHDIIVLCPAVEEYAPYVKSVFRSPFDSEDPNNPRLVCSIADRAPLDADPMVGMFMDMLNLPDSRFSVKSLIDYLHIDSVQSKFDLSIAEVELCEKWISDANIFWGKNAVHKAQSLGAESSSELYTWEWGLARLLKSAFYADTQEDSLSFAMLHNVEGQDTRVLGKLILFVQTLHNIDQGLRQSKPMQAWLDYVQSDILQTLFADRDDNRIMTTLKRAIEQISGNISKAEYTHKVSLAVAREALSNVLSRPDPLNQFNTGQVTFGSMVPMRSVPFKVVCILGLNDGVFPRSAQPLSIDLMTSDTAKATDRSRRNEDRYMFLEALVSARNYVYLSYQGRSVKDNSKREPSLVLREFSDYLKRGFGCEVHTQHPLQPFSPKAFARANLESRNWAERPSFAQAWLQVAQQQSQENSDLSQVFTLPHHLYSDELVNTLADPLAAFAHKHLQLSFDRFMDAQDDTEPFVVLPLIQSKINQSMLEEAMSQSPDALSSRIAHLYQSGDLPELNPQADMFIDAFNKLKQDIDFEAFDALSPEHNSPEHRQRDFSHTITVNDQQVHLHGSMEASENGDSKLFLKHSVRIDHVFAFYLNHAIKRQHLGYNVSSTMRFVDMKTYMKEYRKYQDGKSSTPPNAQLAERTVDDSVFDSVKIDAFLKQVVLAFEQSLRAPSLLHMALGVAANQATRKAKATEYADQANVFLSVEGTLKNVYFQNEYLKYFFPNYADTSSMFSAFDARGLEQVYWAHLPAEWEV